MSLKVGYVSSQTDIVSEIGSPRRKGDVLGWTGNLRLDFRQPGMSTSPRSHTRVARTSSNCHFLSKHGIHTARRCVRGRRRATCVLYGPFASQSVARLMVQNRLDFRQPGMSIEAGKEMPTELFNVFVGNKTNIKRKQ